MARKRKKPKNAILHYRRLPIDALHAEIDRARGRNDVRACVDMAKECHRRDPSPAHVELLCKQYELRGRELLQKGLAAEAMTVLGHALSLGAGSADLLRLAFDCGLRSGSYDTATQILHRFKDEADKARARVLLLDEAVTGGEAALRVADPQLAEDVRSIRRAFAAYEQGDDATASAALKPVGLSSACAGWKWLLRGLLAYSRGDSDTATKCWSRVRGEGKAPRLARRLTADLEQASARQATEDAGTPPLASPLADNPRLAKLRQIKAATESGEEKKALTLCRSLIAEIDPCERASYALRLGRAMCGVIDVYPESGDSLRKLFGPLPEDPWYTRVAALALEDTEVDEALYGWGLYVRAPEFTSAIAPPLHGRARAMIWRRMGELAERIEDTGPFRPYEEGEYDAITCYRESVSHFPDCLETQGKLLDALERKGQRREAERHAEQILQRWPDHIPSLVYCAKRCGSRRAHRKALHYLEQARRAAPFDGAIRSEMVGCLLWSARKRLEQGKLHLARQDYEQAEPLCKSDDDSVSLYCKWAALEWRAGQADRAEQLAAKARDGGVHPLQFCYQMAIELSRVQAPAEVRRRFDKELAEQWRTRPTVENAVAVSELTNGYGQFGVDYDGREKHWSAVGDYLERAHSLSDFTEDQLMSMCDCLIEIEAPRLAARYAEKGATTFTENNQFPQRLAEAEYAQGRRKLTRKTRKLLEKANDRARETGDLSTLLEIESLEHGPWAGGAPALIHLFSALAGNGGLDGPFDYRPPFSEGRHSKDKGRRDQRPMETLLFPDLYDAGR